MIEIKTKDGVLAVSDYVRYASGNYGAWVQGRVVRIHASAVVVPDKAAEQPQVPDASESLTHTDDDPFGVTQENRQT